MTDAQKIRFNDIKDKLKKAKAAKNKAVNLDKMSKAELIALINQLIL